MQIIFATHQDRASATCHGHAPIICVVGQRIVIKHPESWPRVTILQGLLEWVRKRANVDARGDVVGVLASSLHLWIAKNSLIFDFVLIMVQPVISKPNHRLHRLKSVLIFLHVALRSHLFFFGSLFRILPSTVTILEEILPLRHLVIKLNIGCVVGALLNRILIIDIIFDRVRLNE